MNNPEAPIEEPPKFYEEPEQHQTTWELTVTTNGAFCSDDCDFMMNGYCSVTGKHVDSSTKARCL